MNCSAQMAATPSPEGRHTAGSWRDCGSTRRGRLEKGSKFSPASTDPSQKPQTPMRTMVYDFSKMRPPKNPIDPEEVATINRILRKYPCNIEGDRTRLHPDLKVTPEERLILRKYLMAKGYHSNKDAVAELDSMADAMSTQTLGGCIRTQIFFGIEPGLATLRLGLLEEVSDLGLA